MYSYPYSHDDDFLFEQQRDRNDPWFRPAEEIALPVHKKDDSLRAIAHDAIQLFRRLLRFTFKR